MWAPEFTDFWGQWSNTSLWNTCSLPWFEVLDEKLWKSEACKAYLGNPPTLCIPANSVYCASLPDTVRSPKVEELVLWIKVKIVSAFHMSRNFFSASSVSGCSKREYMVPIIWAHKVGHIQDSNTNDHASGFCQKGLKGHLNFSTILMALLRYIQGEKANILLLREEWTPCVSTAFLNLRTEPV